MTAQNRQTLKALFETGDTITQSSMSTLIDSFLDIAEVSSQTIAGPITFNQAITVDGSGTIIPVSAGGTGLTSVSAYSVICGGITNTSSFQKVNGQGTSGQVLTSNGANALPTWQNATTGILSTVYPIGSYYINETDSTNPATLFGFGTWVAVQDKFIVGHGSTYTSTGGAASVTLVANNLPASISLSETGAGDGDNSASGLTKFAGAAAGALTRTVTLNNSGGGQSFSIIPPYQAAYIWKRTA